MCACPRGRLLPRFKKSIDYDGVALIGSFSGAARCFAINDIRSGVNRCARAIRENNFAAIRNSFWIDGAMSGPQTPAGTGVFAGRSVTGCPVTGDTGQNRLFARESGRCQR